MTSNRAKPGVVPCAILVVLVLPLLYVLSMGPVCCWRNHSPWRKRDKIEGVVLVTDPPGFVSFERRALTVRFPRTLDPICAPIEWIVRQSQPVDDAVRWYLDLWQ